MKIGWHVVKGMKLALPELGTGRRRFPLQCCPPQTKNDRHPQMTASAFWRKAIDKIGLAPAMTYGENGSI